MNGRWHRDRILGAVFVAIGVIGLLGALAVGWAGSPRTLEQVRVEGPSNSDRDGASDDADGMPDWMGRMPDRMQGGRPEGGMRGLGPGPGDPDTWDDQQGYGWMTPDQGGRGWHRGPGGLNPDASPSPSPSESPAPSASPSATPGQG